MILTSRLMSNDLPTKWSDCYPFRIQPYVWAQCPISGHTRGLLKEKISSIHHHFNSGPYWSNIQHIKNHPIPRQGPLARCVKLWVVHVMPRECQERFPHHRLQSKPLVSDPVRHARAVVHVGIAHSRWHGKRYRHCWPMRNPQLYVSGTRPRVC